MYNNILLLLINSSEKSYTNIKYQYQLFLVSKYCIIPIRIQSCINQYYKDI